MCPKVIQQSQLAENILNTENKMLNIINMEIIVECILRKCRVETVVQRSSKRFYEIPFYICKYPMVAMPIFI